MDYIIVNLDNYCSENEDTLAELQKQARGFKQILKGRGKLFVFRCHAPLENAWCVWDKVDGVIAKISGEDVCADGNRLVVDGDEYLLYRSNDVDMYDVTFNTCIELFNDNYKFVSGRVNERYVASK